MECVLVFLYSVQTTIHTEMFICTCTFVPACVCMLVYVYVYGSMDAGITSYPRQTAFCWWGEEEGRPQGLSDPNFGGDCTLISQ